MICKTDWLFIDITSEIEFEVCIAQRKLLLSSHLVKHPSADNRRKFKEFRTMYNKLIRAAKKVYFEKNKSNLKKCWDVLREAIRKKNDKSKYGILSEDFIKYWRKCRYGRQ